MDPLSAGIQAVGGLITGGIGAADAAKSRQWQTREREASQRYNTSERVASQKYNTSERMASQRYQTDEREAQNQYSEDMYNRYQSPSALARQYQQAGLNPRLAMNNSGVGNASAASGSNGGAPSGSAPSGTHASTPSAPMGFGQGFQDIAGALASLAQAKKAGVETFNMEKLIDEQLRGIKLSNDAQQLTNSVNSKYLDKKTANEVAKLAQDISNGTVTYDILKEQLDNWKKKNIIDGHVADKWLETWRFDQNKKVAETDLANSSVDLNKSSKKRIDELLPYEKNVMSSTEWVNRTQAAVNRLATATELAKSSYYADLQRAAGYDADIKEIDADIAKAKQPQKMQLIDKQVDLLTKQLSALDQAIEKARKENQWFVLNELRGLTKDITMSIYMLTQAKHGKSIPNIDVGGDSSVGIPFN